MSCRVRCASCPPRCWLPLEGLPLTGQLYWLTAAVAFYLFAGVIARRRWYPWSWAWPPLLWRPSLHDLKLRSGPMFFFPDRLKLTCLCYLSVGATLAMLRVNRLPRQSVILSATVLWLVVSTAGGADQPNPAGLRPAIAQEARVLAVLRRRRLVVGT